jgi:hypothetical protein
MKYYNFDTMFRSLRNLLKEFLMDNNIYFEISGGAALWHFEILTDATGAQKINQFLDANTIGEE